jgi:hypothetical protein
MTFTVGLVRVLAVEVSDATPRFAGLQSVVETVATVEIADGQPPLVTTARKSVVVERLPVFNVGLVAPLILAKGLAPVRDCHWIEPVKPVRVIVVPLPVQTGVTAAVAVPPTLAGFTVKTAEQEVMHPFESVIVTVYVPAVLTLMLCEV